MCRDSPIIEIDNYLNYVYLPCHNFLIKLILVVEVWSISEMLKRLVNSCLRTTVNCPLFEKRLWTTSVLFGGITSTIVWTLEFKARIHLTHLHAYSPLCNELLTHFGATRTDLLVSKHGSQAPLLTYLYKYWCKSNWCHTLYQLVSQQLRNIIDQTIRVGKFFKFFVW